MHWENSASQSRFTPPAIAVSQTPDLMARNASKIASRDEAHAVLITFEGPLKR